MLTPYAKLNLNPQRVLKDLKLWRPVEMFICSKNVLNLWFLYFVFVVLILKYVKERTTHWNTSEITQQSCKICKCFSASYSMTLRPERVKRIILSCLLWFFLIVQSFSDHFPVCGHRVSSSSHLSSSPRTSALLAYHPAVMIKQCCCWGAQSLARLFH